MSDLKAQCEHFLKLLEDKKIKQAKAYIDKVEQEDEVAEQVIARILEHCLVTRKSTPMGLTSALYMYKELMMRSLFDYMQSDLFSDKLHKFVYETCLYKPELAVEVRGQEYFKDKMGKQLTEELSILGNTVIILALEIVQFGAKEYPIDFFSDGESRYVTYHKKLLDKKVTFPGTSQMIKPDDKKRFARNHQEWLRKMKEIQAEQDENIPQKSQPENKTAANPKTANIKQDASKTKIQQASQQKTKKPVEMPKVSNRSPEQKKPVLQNKVQASSSRSPPTKQPEAKVKVSRISVPIPKDEINAVEPALILQPEKPQPVQKQPVPEKVAKQPEPMFILEEKPAPVPPRSLKSSKAEIKQPQDLPNQPAMFILGPQQAQPNTGRNTKQIAQIPTSRKEQKEIVIPRASGQESPGKEKKKRQKIFRTEREFYSPKKQYSNRTQTQQPRVSQIIQNLTKPSTQSDPKPKRLSLPKTQKKMNSTQVLEFYKLSPSKKQQLLEPKGKTLSDMRLQKNKRKVEQGYRSYRDKNILTLINESRLSQVVVPFLPEYFAPASQTMHALIAESLRIGNNKMMQPSKPFYRSESLAVRLIKSSEGYYIVSFCNVGEVPIFIGYSQALQAKYGNQFSSKIRFRTTMEHKHVEEVMTWRANPAQFVDIPFYFSTLDANFKFLEFVVAINKEIKSFYLPVTLLDQGIVEKNLDLDHIEQYITMHGRICKSSPINLPMLRDGEVELPSVFGRSAIKEGQLLGQMVYNLEVDPFNKIVINMVIRRLNSLNSKCEVVALYDNRNPENENFAKVLLELLCFLLAKD